MLFAIVDYQKKRFFEYEADEVAKVLSVIDYLLNKRGKLHLEKISETIFVKKKKKKEYHLVFENIEFREEYEWNYKARLTSEYPESKCFYTGSRVLSNAMWEIISRVCRGE